MNLLERMRTCRSKRRDFGTAEKIVEKLLFIAALSSTLIVFFIIAFMFKEGIPALALGWDFFFGMIWSPSHNQYGIIPLVVCTFIVGIGALLIAAVIGVPAAISGCNVGVIPIDSRYLTIPGHDVSKKSELDRMKKLGYNVDVDFEVYEKLIRGVLG